MCGGGNLAVKTIDIEKATGPLKDYAAAAQQEVVVVTRKGKPVAAVVPLDDADYESLSLSTNPRFVEIIARSRVRLEKEGGIPADEVRRRLGISKSKNGKRASDRKMARFRAGIAKAERDIVAGRFISVEKLRRKY
jgi:prevent-host-death family protein